jgi:hypothetical protein
MRLANTDIFSKPILLPILIFYICNHKSATNTVKQSLKNIRILGTRILRKGLKSEEGLKEMAKDIINFQTLHDYFQQ